MIELDVVEHGAIQLQYVWPTVVIVVEKFHGDAAQQNRFVSDAGMIRVVIKSSIVIVMVELGFLPFVIPWMAVRAITRAMLAAPDIIFRRPFDVIGDEQIQPAVFVIVKPSGAGGPSAQVGNGGFFGDVSKGAIAIV